MLRRKDGSGILVIRRAGKLPADLNAFTLRLDRQFRGRFHSAFARQSAKVLNQRSGKAFNYVYINKAKGTVNSVTVVPAKHGSFTLNSVAQGGKKDVAGEIGRMIVSFDDR